MRTFCGDMFEEGQTEADLSGQKLGDEGAILLAWDLRAGFVSTLLTNLSLADNGIGKDGTVALAKALEVNDSLKSLNLQNNFIDDKAKGMLNKAAKTRGVALQIHSAG